MKDKEITTTVELTYDDLPDEVDIVGISFRAAGKIYYFASGGVICREGEHAIVETTRGAEYGIVTISNHLVPKKELILPLRSVIRVATEEDDRRFEQNALREEEAFGIALKKIEDHKLDMKLVDVEYTFDNSKLLFYFTADDRVDFRELVKDLASVFRTRIELRQIGIRDEAKMMGGLGICGREFCCHSFLGDFAQVTIKMAKEQNLSLNAAKISGACGKLMCCLRFEHESYQQEIALTPKVDSQVTTPDGPGVVVASDPLRGICNVRLSRSTDNTVTPYHRDLLNRPENPTADLPVPQNRSAEQAHEEFTPKSETPRRERTERPARQPKSEQHVERIEILEKDKPARPERTQSEAKNELPAEGRGNRPFAHAKGDRNKKKGDHKNQPRPADEKRADTARTDGQHIDTQKVATPQNSSKSSNDRRDHSERASHKHNRPAPNDKKSDSKFDVKFGGGELPQAAHSESKPARPTGEGRHHHHRPHRGEKKNDKKVQKTENNN